MKRRNDGSDRKKLEDLLRRIMDSGYENDPELQALLYVLTQGERLDNTLFNMAKDRSNYLDFLRVVRGDCFPPASPDLDGPIRCGTLDTPDGVRLEFGLFPYELNEHVLVVGSAGSGKTSLAIHLIREVLSRYGFYPGKAGGLKLQIYDCKNDYTWLYKEFGGVWVLPFEKRLFNPLEVPSGVAPKKHAGMFVDVFCNSFFIFDVGRNILFTELMDLYGRFGVLGGSGRFPTLRQLCDALSARRLSGTRAREARESLLNRMEGMLALFGGSLDCSRGYGLEELHRHSIVYDVSGLPGYFRSFVISFDLVSAWRFHQAHGLRGNQARLLFVFDEAHTVFSSDLRQRTASSGEKPLLFEAYPMLREFGIGVMCLTQSPRSLDEATILSNTGCKIVKNLNDGNDVAEMGRSLMLTPEQQARCGALSKREAVARLSSRHRRPFLFEVPDVRVDKSVDWLWLESVMKTKLQGLNTAPPVTPPTPQATKPHGPSLADQVHVKQLLFDVYNLPFEPVSDRYSRLFGSAGGMGNRIKNLVLQWRYAQEIKIHTGGRSGLKSFLEILPAGLQLIGMPPQQRSGIGDFEHQYWQHRLCEECIKRGFSPEKEMQVRGKRVDVGLRYPALIAFEIATTSGNELVNAQKDLAAGFQLIFFCAVSKTVESQIQHIIFHHFSASDWKHFELRTIQNLLQEPAWF